MARVRRAGCAMALSSSWRVRVFRRITLLAKSLLIAVGAAITSTLCLAAILYARGEVGYLTPGYSLEIFKLAAMGCFVIGLPIAGLIFLFSGKHLARSFTTSAMVGALSGIMMVLASFVVGAEMGVAILGIPAFMAALTFTVLGWFWILKPERNRAQGAANV